MVKAWMLLAVAILATFAVAAQETRPSSAPQFTADGNLKQPADYREWGYVTSGDGRLDAIAGV